MREAWGTRVGSTEQYIRNEREVKIKEYQELEKKLNEVRKEESTQEKAVQEAKQIYSSEKDKENQVRTTKSQNDLEMSERRITGSDRTS